MARGRFLAALLGSESSVSGEVATQWPARIAVRSTVTGRYIADDDFAEAARWGHFGAGDAVMPGRGRVIERVYRLGERTALAAHIAKLGETTFDVYLNEEAYWSNVPAAVWDYRLGGYQVLKKWRSYRERKVLGRKLRRNKVRHFAHTARSIGTLLLASSGGPDRRPQ